MLHRTPFLIMLASISACGTDPALDPVGVWSATLTYGQGDCGLTGTVELEREISDTPGGYAFSGTDPDRTASANVACSPDSCVLDFIETNGIGTFTAHWNADTGRVISGSGFTQVSSPQGSCSQAGIVSGLLLR